jgi:hypothetical protein
MKTPWRKMKIILKRTKRHILPQELRLNILGRKKGSSYGAKETWFYLCYKQVAAMRHGILSYC